MEKTMVKTTKTTVTRASILQTALLQSGESQMEMWKRKMTMIRMRLTSDPSANYSSTTDVHQESRGKTAHCSIPNSVGNSSRVADQKRDVRIGTVTSCIQEFVKKHTSLGLVRSLGANNGTSRQEGIQLKKKRITLFYGRNKFNLRSTNSQK